MILLLRFWYTLLYVERRYIIFVIGPALLCPKQCSVFFINASVTQKGDCLRYSQQTLKTLSLVRGFICFSSLAAGRKKKKGHGEAVIPPRSLFDKASMVKVRREGKDQKKNFSLKHQAPFAKPLPSLVKPAVEAGQDNPEWLISEDWALLQVLGNTVMHIHRHTHYFTVSISSRAQWGLSLSNPYIF